VPWLREKEEQVASLRALKEEVCDVRREKAENPRKTNH